LGVSTSKKVVLQRFDRDPVSGFINPGAWLTPAGVELITVSGAVLTVPYSEIRWVSFVREFGSDPTVGMRRAFLSRPRMEGLWLKLLFRDQSTLEGVIGNDLLQVESLGLHVLPPDTAQRIWVPRAALAAIQVLGVTGSPWRSKKKPAAPREQIGLFEGNE
jgi:hypothetical protein